MEFEQIYKTTNSGKFLYTGELIRCKDCIHADDFDCPAPLPTGYSCEKGHGTHTGDWYCADGEKKE